MARRRCRIPWSGVRRRRSGCWASGARPGREAGRRDSRSRGVVRPAGRSTPLYAGRRCVRGPAASRWRRVRCGGCMRAKTEKKNIPFTLPNAAIDAVVAPFCPLFGRIYTLPLPCYTSAASLLAAPRGGSAGAPGRRTGFLRRRNIGVIARFVSRITLGALADRGRGSCMTSPARATSSRRERKNGPNRRRLPHRLQAISGDSGQTLGRPVGLRRQKAQVQQRRGFSGRGKVCITGLIGS